MSISKLMFAVAVAGCTTAFAASAYADNTPSRINCMKMSREVTRAIGTHAQSSGVDTAKGEQHTGDRLCMNGYFQAGMDRYASALKILGSSASSENQTH